MRWIVYGLLVLNLGLLTWNLQSSAGTAPHSARGQDEQAGAGLPLLEELSKDSLRQRTIALEGSPGGEGAAVDDVIGGDVISGAVTSPRTSAAVRALASKADDKAGSQISDTADGRTQASPGLAEVPGEAADNESALASASASPASTAEHSAARACLTLGPLAADAPIAPLRSWLQRAGASVDVHAGERREVTLHWVYFPPLATRKAALAEVERLLGEGLTDVVVVPKGDMANAISLGVFSRSESRDRRLKEMGKRGYEPSVAPRYGVKLATWVDVSAPADAFSDNELRQRWPQLVVRRKPCPGPAAAIEHGNAQPIAVAHRAFYNSVLVAQRRSHDLR